MQSAFSPFFSFFAIFVQFIFSPLVHFVIVLSLAHFEPHTHTSFQAVHFALIVFINDPPSAIIFGVFSGQSEYAFVLSLPLLLRVNKIKLMSGLKDEN